MKRFFYFNANYRLISDKKKAVITQPSQPSKTLPNISDISLSPTQENCLDLTHIRLTSAPKFTPSLFGITGVQIYLRKIQLNLTDISKKSVTVRLDFNHFILLDHFKPLLHHLYIEGAEAT